MEKVLLPYQTCIHLFIFYMGKYWEKVQIRKQLKKIK